MDADEEVAISYESMANMDGTVTRETSSSSRTTSAESVASYCTQTSENALVTERGESDERQSKSLGVEVTALSQMQTEATLENRLIEAELEMVSAQPRFREVSDA